MLTVADIMTRQPATVAAAATVAQALDAMRARGISSLLVLPPPGSTEYGIVTMRDVIGRIVKDGLAPESVQVGDIMTWRLVTARPSWSLQQAAAQMARAGVRRLPVADGSEIVGLISDTDVFTALAAGSEWEHVRRARKERALRRAAATGAVRVVADLMSAPVLTISEQAPVEEAVRKMVAAGISSLLATDAAGQMRGIVTKRDVVIKVVAEGRDPRDIAVGQIMSSPVRAVAVDLSIEECSLQMASAGLRRFAVERGGAIAGIISDSDILAAVGGRRWVGRARGPASAVAADVMHPAAGDILRRGIDSLTPEMSIWDCAARLAQTRARELPVVQDGRVIGIVGEADILRAIEERGGLH
jgi:CBS domain-containing protein